MAQKETKTVWKCQCNTEHDSEEAADNCIKCLKRETQRKNAELFQKLLPEFLELKEKIKKVCPHWGYLKFIFWASRNGQHNYRQYQCTVCGTVFDDVDEKIYNQVDK
ncbi:MAG: hypothetical protein V1867_05600 [Candidatus Falkowbacteria bacterium]